MEQDIDALYASAVVLAGQARDASCAYLQQRLVIGWQLARRIHAHLVADRAYLRLRHGEIRPAQPGRRLIRLFCAGKAGNTMMAELGDSALREAAVGFDTDREGRLYLVDECGHTVGRVALTDQRGQRLAMFEALARSTRIVLVAGDLNEPAAAALLPLLGEGARAAGAWVVWLQCLGTGREQPAAIAGLEVPADLVCRAACFDIPGLDAGQVNVLAALRVLRMLEQEFGGQDVPGR
ncbi:MAG TPA: hypothetical protein VE092_12655 [Herbaspirillum sp.]|uniref:hypothetical protein n=1 Tax=Herbaspirillum sp. TaxID=1890675 RepID=UPI002D38FFBA|nr:hypothetical protein [Herbaspirillum sp.]HZG20862.1 hypothetical protein [Herbaspirillum sp.]